jgi:phosphoribosylformimino-5-aminoimidazole carboxamide ribotide isomerase
MVVFPAIDLKNGNCVRLLKGDFNELTTYNSDPLSVAKRFEDEGATWLHVIDLDGAQTGTNKNLEVIKELCENTNLNIQVGGGVRDLEKIGLLLSYGVKRVILGTFALENIDKLRDVVMKYNDQVIVSVDSSNGFVTYHGWQTISQIETIEFCKKLEEIGIKTIVYTDISKDGMMSGPAFNDYLEISKFTNLEVIASGGVSSYDDLKRLNKMNLYGAIIGKALYINKVTVKECIECLLEE